MADFGPSAGDGAHQKIVAKPLTVPGLDSRKPHAQARPRHPAALSVAAYAGAAARGNPVTDGSLSWLVFSYRVPRDRARLRVAVWRRSALCVGSGRRSPIPAVQPSCCERRQWPVRPRWCRHPGQRIRQIFDQCHDLLTEVHSRPTGGFTYAALDQNDRRLAKLADRLAKTRAIDSFGASQAGSAAALLA
jgi:hypothetical protein